MAWSARPAIARRHLGTLVALGLVCSVVVVAFVADGRLSRAGNAVARQPSTTATVAAPSSTEPATTTTPGVKTEVLGTVVARTDPPAAPPSTQPPPPRSYLYGPEAGFPRGATITVGSTIEAPALAAALDYWNRLAGRSLFVVATDSPVVTLRAGAGICDTGLVACAAPASALDHHWHPNMDYPFESCDVYLLPPAVGDWAVIAHELGHCLGFDHVTDWLSIMTPSPQPDPVGDRNILVGAGYAAT